MSKKQNKVLKVVGIIVVAWLVIGFTNYLIHSKIVTSSNSNAQMQGPDNGGGGGGSSFGGGGGGGGYSTGGWWQTTWMGPLCWENGACW